MNGFKLLNSGSANWIFWGIMRNGISKDLLGIDSEMFGTITQDKAVENAFCFDWILILIFTLVVDDAFVMPIIVISIDCYGKPRITWIEKRSTGLWITLRINYFQLNGRKQKLIMLFLFWKVNFHWGFRWVRCTAKWSHNWGIYLQKWIIFWRKYFTITKIAFVSCSSSYYKV